MARGFSVAADVLATPISSLAVRLQGLGAERIGNRISDVSRIDASLRDSSTPAAAPPVADAPWLLEPSDRPAADQALFAADDLALLVTKRERRDEDSVDTFFGQLGADGDGAV